MDATTTTHEVETGWTRWVGLAGRVLRAPQQVVAEATADLAAHAPGLVGWVLAGSALWAGVVGAYRGGLQLVYAPVKAPLLLLLPLALAAPALRVLFDPEGERLSTPQLAGAALVSMARTALLLGAVAPLLWLYLSLEPDYHDAVLALAGSLGLASLPGLWTMAVSLSGPRRAWGAMLSSLALLSALTAQTGWMLRPFVVRPTAEVAFLRPVEGDIGEAMQSTTRSAQGVYDGRFKARPSGVIGHRWPEEAE